MDAEVQLNAAVQFYEAHPINEYEILEHLKRDGVACEGLTESVLKNYDQDHFGGLEAVDILAEKAGIGRSTHVLDVCSGLGGPARYLADCLGCRVTGLDITESRHQGAVRLTKLVKLDHLVDFRLGNALDMPFANGTFDATISQEAFVHIPEKPRLIGECARVVRPGGVIAFTDIVRKDALKPSTTARLQGEMAMPNFESLDGYERLLEGTGCTVIVRDDLSEWWTEVLVRRLEMYRSLRETTIEKFGEDHFRRWDETYAFFVSLFADGQLGGARLVATRNS